MAKTLKRKGPNPNGNPNFKTDNHPAKLRQEGEEPANATLAIRIPMSLKLELKNIPNRVIREWLWELVKMNSEQ